MSTNTDFRLAVRIYYEDTDFSGVVYHAAYLKFFERGRTEALRACGIHHSELLERDDPLIFAVRKVGLEWRKPARIDDFRACPGRPDLHLSRMAARGFRKRCRRRAFAVADLVKVGSARPGPST